MFNIGLYRQNMKKYSCLKPKRGFLIIGAQHHLMGHEHVCSNYARGAKMALPWGSFVLHRLI